MKPSRALSCHGWDNVARRDGPKEVTQTNFVHYGRPNGRPLFADVRIFLHKSISTILG